ncbi:MAG: insulinase family protein [Acidobacteriota bacterium]|nr:MAG: insulinase family protein [Acidobacteriota bacterium]
MIRKSRLSNGISVLTEPMPHLRSVSVAVWLRKGSRHELSRHAGISHFVEHMVFKGTKNRSARDIAVAIDSIGGSFDAFTAKEHTAFYFRVLDEHLTLALDLVADIVLNPLFKLEDMQKERQVIEEEIRMSEDDPTDIVHELFAKAVFPRHPLGRPIAGTRETLHRITPHILGNFFKDSYVPRNMVVALAGRVRHRRTVDALEKLFRGLKSTRQKPTPRQTPRFRPATRIRRKPALEQAHFLLGVEGVNARSPLRYPLSIMNTVLGDGMSSRLFQKIREEAGLAYSVYSFLQSYADTGFFAVYAGVAPRNLKRALAMAVREIRGMARDGLTKEELRRAKEQLKGGFMLASESSAQRMTRIAITEILGRRQETLNKTLDRIERVRRSDVLRAARTLFAKERFALSLVGGKGMRKMKVEDVL